MKKENRLKIAAVILAAGGAKRFGYPKPLLLWKGKPFFEHLFLAAQAIGFYPQILVSGAYHDEISKAAEKIPLQIVYNPEWEKGQSTSVRMAIRALPDETEAAVFMLADQPFISPTLLAALADAFLKTRAPVIAPYVGDQRANPLLFARLAFPLLAEITGDQGGRAILDRFPIYKLPWQDSIILFDVDTPEDYSRLKEMEKIDP